MTSRIQTGVAIVIGFLAVIVAGCADKQPGPAPAVTSTTNKPAPATTPTPAAPATTAKPAGELQVAVVNSFATGGEVKGWDDLLVDPVGRRVYVAQSTRVMVFDADKGTLVGELAGLNGAHGVAVVPELNQGYATSGRDNAVVLFDLKTLKATGKIMAGKGPDGILYDPASKKVFAFNHAGGDATIIKPAATTRPETATLDLGGKAVEFGAIDGKGHVYVNLEDKSEVVAIDSLNQKVIGHWSVAPGEGPTGLAMDPTHRRLFAGCGNKMVIVLDADSGKLLASLPAGDGIDGVAFIPPAVGEKFGVAISSNGRDGTATVVREGPAGKFTTMTITTAKGARTIKADNSRAYLPATLTGKDGKPAFGLLVLGMGPAAGK